MHILFVTEKYCDGVAALGLSNHSHNLFGSLTSTGLATWDALYVDQCAIDDALAEYVSDSDRLAKLSAVVFAYFGDSHLNPSLEAVKRLHGLGLPLAFIFTDTVYTWADNLLASLEPYAKVAVCFDTPEIQRPPNIIPMFVPQDPRLYYPDMKSLEACFVGSPFGHRGFYLDHLRQSGLPVTITGGQRAVPKLSADDYAKIIRQSKISINFAWSHSPVEQCKGRVFETMACKTLLLESKNSVTTHYFRPGVDYVEFISETDLVDKIRYYLSHHAERESIAASGHQRYLERYTAKHFWTTVFGKLAQ